MPIIKSAKKALRQSHRRQKNNLVKKESYKKAVKEYKKTLASGGKEKAASMLPKVYKALDKAAKGGVIHKNKASNLKSRLTKLSK